MAVSNENAVKYPELTDEIITDYKQGIELFVKSKEYWDKFAHHSVVPKGHKTFSSRRLIKPKVKPEDIKPSAELVAPRPTKMSLATFEKTVENYRDKAIYSKEDMQFHFDDTVNNLRYTLQEIVLQKKNLIKGAAFIATRALITYNTSMRQTLRDAVKILRKNGVKRWDGKHFLAHMTLEEQAKLRAEIDAASEKSEKMRLTLEGVDFEFDVWEDWLISVPEDDEYTLYKNDSTHYMVLMGKRGIDGASPVDVSKLKGEPDVELLNKGLGHGVLQDVDGNYTSDDNNQQGVIAVNMLGLGACVSDDLSILLCEVSVNTVPGTALAISNLSGYVSHSGNEVEVSLTGTNIGNYTSYLIEGARFDATARKYYATRNSVIAVKVVADADASTHSKVIGAASEAGSGKTLGSLTASNWSAEYKNISTGSAIGCDVLAIAQNTKANDTLIVRVPNDCVSFTIAMTASAS